MVGLTLVIKARAQALRELIQQQLPLGVVARRSGVHRSTIWRWLRKWQEKNQFVRLENSNRPSRNGGVIGTVFRWSNVSWVVPTLSSAPHSHPYRLAGWIVARILELRHTLQRCAEVIHLQLSLEQIKVSLSSVKRTLRRHRLCARLKRRPYRRTLPRPEVTKPGSLVEVDTVHYVNRLTGERRYITTVIDLYTRLAHAKLADKLSPSLAAEAVREAEASWGFSLLTVQSDNGPEFSRWFSEQLTGQSIVHRKTRIHRPNDNAHIERFNRTLREECIGDHMSGRLTTAALNQKLAHFLDYYNHKRLHLGIQCIPIQMLRR